MAMNNASRYPMRTAIKKLAYRGRDFLNATITENIRSTHHDTVSQLQLKLTYRTLAASGAVLPNLKQVGFKSFSQTDEDGILLYIFSIIGAANMTCVEICAGTGIECNTANLLINHGWHGLLVDGNEVAVKTGQAFYQQNPSTKVYPPVFVHSWITRGNVNEVLSKNGFEGEIDLLSIDLDGVDYWIWDAIEVIRPRVVAVEYQDIIGPDRSLTVPYSDDFNAYVYPKTSGMPNFCGASLPAFVKLARKNGYRLVGCNRLGYNAFFVLNPYGERDIPEIDIRECFTHPKVLWGMKERYPTVKDLPWVEV
jgi:hypothetical protein